MRSYVYTSEGIEQVNRWLDNRKFFSFDLETGPKPQWASYPGAALDPYLGQPVLALIGDQEDQWIVDTRASLDLTRVGQAVKDPDTVKIGANLRFDTKYILHHYGWYPERLLDVQIQEQVLRAGLFTAAEAPKPGQIRKMTKLSALVKFYFGVDIDKDKDLRKSFGKTPIGEFSERQLDYAAGDLVWPERVARAQKPIIVSRGMQATIQLEMDLIAVLADMELEGMELDVDAWLELYQEAVAEYASMENKFDEFFGFKSCAQEDMFGGSTTIRQANYSSPPQLAKLLHKAGIPGFVDSQGKTLSTASQDVLIGKLTGTIPAGIADTISTFRKAEQRKENYGLNIIAELHPLTGKIHPDLTQATLVTGRISCSPGLQTIPRLVRFMDDKDKTPYHPYRNAFVAGHGYRMSIQDASQIEARIIADKTQDPVAVKCFLEFLDIYKHDAEIFYNVKIDKKTPEGKQLRDQGKVSWLGLGYGQGKRKFNRFCMVNLGRFIPQAETDYLFDKFFELHSVMKEEMDRWSSSVDPEGDGPSYHDDLAESLINHEKVWDNVYKALLNKAKGNKIEAERRTRRLLNNKGRVRYSEGYGGRKRQYRIDMLGHWTAGRNGPIQNGAATIQKESMVELARFARLNNYKSKLINTVHDEIISKCPVGEIDEYSFHHARIMTEVGQKYLEHVPMKVEGTTAECWVKS